MKIRDKIEELRLRRKGITLLKVSDEALTQYKLTVKGHKNDSDLLARKFITRNWVLTESNQKIEFREDKLVSIRNYGNLLMTMNLRTGVIINLENRRGYYKLNINETKKAELNKILGLK